MVHDRVETSNPIGDGDSDPYNPTGQRTVGGVYLKDKATYEWLEVIAGLRYDVNELESDGTSNSGSRLSPRLTVGVSPFEEGPLSGLQVYGTYAEGYRSPSITETLIEGTHPAFAIFPFLPNASLDPEAARTWELGINYSAESLLADDDRLQVKAAYFNNALSNYIGMNDAIPTGTGGCAAPPASPIFAPGFPPRVVGINTGTCAQFQNIAAAEIEGFELEALYDQQTWFAGLSASIIEGHVDDCGVQSPLLSIPTTQLTGTAGFRLLEGSLTVGGEVQHNWMPEGATGDDYTLVNLFASYKVSEDVSFSARVDNLFRAIRQSAHGFDHRAGLRTRPQRKGGRNDPLLMPSMPRPNISVAAKGKRPGLPTQSCRAPWRYRSARLLVRLYEADDCFRNPARKRQRGVSVGR